MPRDRKISKVVEPNFERDFKAMVKNDIGKQSVLDAFFVLCMVFDQIVSEDNTWFTIGLQKGGGTLQLTLHEGRDLTYANATDLQGWLSALRSL